MCLRNFRKVAALAFCILVAILAQPAAAKDRPWFKYENAFFQAYSDASEKRVLRLLEELENFRAVVEQVVAFEIPPGAPKTRVFIFRSGREFRKVAGDRRFDGFMMIVGGIPHIVMASGRASDEQKTMIRHEFAHVLLAYSNLRLPRWYNEGFAEYISATSFREKGTQFTLGEVTDRQWSRASLVPWGELLADNFEFHSIKANARISNGYLQSWLLVHYLLHADNSSHYTKLSTYLGRFAAGESSEDAIRAVFGMTPDELGETVMKTYRSTQAYVMNFNPDIQDHNFERTAADQELVDRVIADVRAQIAAWLD